MYLERKKNLPQKHGNSAHLAKDLSLWKICLLNNCNVDNNCYLYKTYYYATIKIQKLLRDLYLKIYYNLPTPQKKVLKRITTKGLPTIDDTI